MPAELNTTSYALLSLLSVKSWTGYELAQQSRLALASYWPKEDSVLYKESRRLVALGLASTTTERSNGRDRKRYAITESGRAELREWLTRPAAAPRFEIEPIVRLTAAHEGEPAQALAAVDAVRVWAQDLRDRQLAYGRAYWDGDAEFQDRAHINVVGGSLFQHLYTAAIEWAEWAEQEIKTWERTDGLGLTPGTRQKLAELLGEESFAADN